MKFKLQTIFLAFVFSIAIRQDSSADLVLRDTTDTLTPSAALMVMTTNSPGASPSIEIAAAPFDRTITEIRLQAVRATGTPDYSNYNFAFAEVLDFENYRTIGFTSSVVNNMPYAFTDQTTLRSEPDEIIPFMLGGFQVEELVFRNLSLEVDANESFSFVAGGIPELANGQSIFLIYSDGSEFADRFQQGTNNGGLIPNLDFGLPHSEFGVFVGGVSSVPEPNATVIIVAVCLASARRARRYPSQKKVGSPKASPV